MAAEKKEVYLGDVEKSIENVDQIDKRAVLTVHEIITKYRDLISSAAEYGKIRGFPIKPQWIAAFVETETGGLPRPKFEHHWLYSYYSGKSRGGVVTKGSLSNIRNYLSMPIADPTSRSRPRTLREGYSPNR